MEAPSVPPPVIVDERPGLDQTGSHSIGHRQQVSIGVGVADGSYSKFGQDTSLNGTALAAIRYHWLVIDAGDFRFTIFIGVSNGW